MGYQILWLPWEGASEAPPSEIKEGVIFDPMLLYRICHLVFLGVTCKESARNLKIWARFQDFKIFEIEISHHLDKQKIGITRLILKIQDSNFKCKPNFHSRTNHIFTSMSKDHFFRLKYDIFKNILWVDLFRGPVGGVKNKNSIKFFYNICSTWFYENSKILRVLAITVPEKSQ